MSRQRSKEASIHRQILMVFFNFRWDYGMCPILEWHFRLDERGCFFLVGISKYQAVSYMYGSNGDYICSSLRRDLCSNSKILLQDFGKSRVKGKMEKRADMRGIHICSFSWASR